MDRITESQLNIFCKEYSLTDRPQDVQFEHFAAFSTVKRHYDRTFDPSEIVIGAGGDTGIDAVAIIVNNVLVTDIDTIAELAEQNGYIDATFVFVQAERSSSFDGAKIANLANGIADFFRDEPKLVRNELLTKSAEMAKAVYDKVGMFRQRPTLICYYVTTGNWVGDANLVARETIAKDEFNSMQMFSKIDFDCFGATSFKKPTTRRAIQFRENLFLQIALTFRRRQELDKPSLALSLTTNSKPSSAILAERKFWAASSRATSEIGKSIRPSTKIFSERLRQKPALGSFL